MRKERKVRNRPKLKVLYSGFHRGLINFITAASWTAHNLNPDNELAYYAIIRRDLPKKP